MAAVKPKAGEVVTIHGHVIENVLTYDLKAGEVWCHDGEDKTKAKELKTGTVAVHPKDKKP